MSLSFPRCNTSLINIHHTCTISHLTWIRPSNTYMGGLFLSVRVCVWMYVLAMSVNLYVYLFMFICMYVSVYLCVCLFVCVCVSVLSVCLLYVCLYADHHHHHLQPWHCNINFQPFNTGIIGDGFTGSPYNTGGR